MVTTVKAAGTYKLERFVLSSLTSDRSINAADPRRGTFATGASSSTTVDLSNLVHSFSITESVLSGTVRGTAVIYDAVGAFYTFPISGQEVLVIEYTDTKGVTQTDRMFVYSVTDIRPGKDSHDDYLEYKLHFCSFGKFWSDRFDVRRCIAEGTGTSRSYLTIAEQVQTIFDDYYVDQGRGTRKSIEISATDGSQKIVIPNLKPEDAMHLMSRRAFTTEYSGQFYRFFENRQGYFFANMEEVFALSLKDQLFFYNSGPTDTTPEAEIERMQNIINLDLGESVNAFEAMSKGGYNRKFVELDPLTRSKLEYDYSHTDNIPLQEYPDGRGRVRPSHSQEMIDVHLNKVHEVYGIKDYPDPDASAAFGLRPPTFYSDIYNSKNAMIYHFGQSKITITIYGTNEVVAGSVIQLQDIPQFGVDRGEQVDQDRIGYWLVETAVNQFYENTYTQTLTLTKGGFLQ